MQHSSSQKMYHSTIDPGEKKTLKRIEIPLNKFNHIAVPYHVDLLHKHKINIERFERLGQWQAAHREHVNAGRAVQQLKALLHEIDGLREQVQDGDLKEFSKRTAQARKSVQDAIQVYLDMEKPGPLSPSQEWPAGREGGVSLEEAQLPPLQVQLHSLADEEEEVASREAYLRSWEQLHTEVQDLQQLFQDFATVVHAQGELVSQVETHVDTAAENVHQGAQSLARASSLKAASYPLFGAVLGGCMGGPIGLFAGLKLGGLAAISGGILGFTGGKFLKNKQVDSAPEEVDPSSLESKPQEDTYKSVTQISTTSNVTACLSLIS